ncbi:MAG: alpha/beta hydrolase [Anaerolineales bacterium]
MEKINDTRQIDGWVVRQRRPAGEGPFRLILLLHGWTGDEDAMWVFASRLPKDAYLVAPRGLYKAPLGGYGWHEHKSKIWPWVDDFEHTIQALLDLLSPENFPDAITDRFDLVGFSQGAACSYALALQKPRFVDRLAGLSGFLPDGADAIARNQPLKDRRVFIAHGTKDNLVPVEKARSAVEILKRAGASVIYCEDDVGHKLSANCFNGLENFFSS